MADVIMPQMGESIAEGTVTKWLKTVGDRIERPELIRQALRRRQGVQDRHLHGRMPHLRNRRSVAELHERMHD